MKHLISIQRTLFSLFFLLSIGSVWANVPNPTVVGPIASVQPGDPSHNYPFGATTINLQKVNYLEEEYFLSGIANRYDLTTGAILDSGPYQTRAIVLRPKQARKFNGTVILQPFVSTFGFDMDVLFARSHDFLINEGYAVIGITGDASAVNQLKAWAAPSGRYNALTLTNDGHVYDIISQTAQSVRNPSGINLMHGLAVKRIILAGFSRKADTITTYHNIIQSNANMIDGFLILNLGGATRTDLPNPVPVVRLLAETEVAFSFLANSTQPDSDYFRLWEVAGANHYDNQTNNYLAPIFTRDGVSGPNLTTCTFQPVFSRIPFYKVQNAAINGLNRWIRHGIALPIAPRIDQVAGVIVRDSDGNATGGIQLAEQDVATATNFQNAGPGLCFLAGAYTPFTQARVDELYPTHGNYVIKVIEVTHNNLKDGYVLPSDALETLVKSATSDIGK